MYNGCVYYFCLDIPNELQQLGPGSTSITFPLIPVKCPKKLPENMTPESLWEQLINEATNNIRTEMDKAFRRAGLVEAFSAGQIAQKPQGLGEEDSVARTQTDQS